jgi:amino acid adenylation domain-containing protein
LYEFNDTYADYPRDKTIHQLFEEQVDRTSDNIALVFMDEQMTYSELNARANQVARALREKGVKADSIVGIMAERSFEMIVGILGILKAGGAYLPLDPEYPKERIKFMLEDSEAKILLTQSNLKGMFKFEVDISELEDYTAHEGVDSNLEPVNGANDLAYVIYTSGSTGKPKGVIVEHRSVVNLLHGMEACYPLEKGNVYLLKTAYIFDVSVPELFSWFISGEKLVILPPGYEGQPKEIINAISENKITHLNFVPSMLSAFLEETKNHSNEKIQSLKYLFAAGEVLKQEAVCSFYKYLRNASLENIYGPTEATVYVTKYNAVPGEKNSSVPIGKPMANYKVYILSPNKGLSPIGVSGELCIGGDGLARGYLNRPELTAEKFVENPYITCEHMFRTGDLARWLPDGNIEFLERIDDQVKIRGFRIELGEIESRLLEIESVKEAVVLAREDELGDKYLCAYVVAEEELLVKELRERLAESLPDYMVTSYFVQLTELPLNPNGKVDRKALLAPECGLVSGTEYETPRTKTEEILAKLWSDVLGVDKVGIHDNFFELGGHSLRATAVTSRIYKEFNIELPIKELFKAPTIAEVSKYLAKARPSAYTSIEVTKEKEYYEVSSAQKRMYVLQQLNLDGTGYNMSAVMIVDGALEKERLRETVFKLAERHEALRTSFESVEDQIVQRIHKDILFSLEYSEEIGGHANIEEYIEGAARGFIRPFDLSKAPLLRMKLIKLAKERHLLLFDMHHIISDGTSMSILIKEFVDLYGGKELDKQRIQYKDFSQWQNNYMKSEDMQRQKRYWLEMFSDEVPALDMPLDYIRPAMREFGGGNITLQLGEELTKKLRTITKETGTTLYMVLLSVINILLSKYSGQEDIVIGTLTAGRSHVDLEKIIGIFINTLAMRNYPESNKSYDEFLREVKENALKAYENQDYQVEELIENLNLRRDMSRNSLFDVMFLLQNVETAELELEGIKFKSCEPKEKNTAYDLMFTAMEEAEDIRIDIDYCLGVFKKVTIERLGGHLCNLLEAITENRAVLLGEMDILSAKERNKVLYEFNDTYMEYPQDKTIQQLFEEQVDRTPDNIALVFRNERITYNELNRKANQVARVLRGKGVKPDNIVGIIVKRSFEMIIGILGVLKAGGAYLPLDPEYPKGRIKFMLDDSGANILLTQSWFKGNLKFEGEIIELDDGRIYKGDVSNLEPINCVNDLAYVIYTSGSTGNPKGVMIEHQSVINLACGQITGYKINELDRILQFYTISFDPFVEQLFIAIMSGASLYLIDKDTLLDTSRFSAFMQDNAITHMDAVPSFLDNLDLRELVNLKRVAASGEACTINLIKRLNKNRIHEFYNSYGPTETTVTSNVYHIANLEELIITVPIGKPIANYKAYILDKDAGLSPIGVAGELCIGGDGLARGYLNRLELTVEKFVENPFIPGERIYRTGDLARWLPDGNVEFLGRIDEQVKIRGFRVELGEIERRLLEIEAVKEAVVLAWEDERNSKYLCAYVVGEKELLIKELSECLSESLPDYMIPAYFVQLMMIPLTKNGKADRKALPMPDSTMVAKAEYEGPRNETEEVLARIWSEVLGVEKIGVHDSFFEMGGHSLKGTIMVARIHKELNVKLPLVELFKTPTIAGIGDYISKSRESIFASIEVAKEKEYYEASSAQKRMFVLQQMNPDNSSYNIPMVLTIEGDLDKKKLEYAVWKLIERHEVLRTTFEAIDDKIMQRIHRDVTLTIEYTEEIAVHLGSRENYKEYEEYIDELVEKFIRPFDLGQAPLLRVRLIKLAKEKYLLLFDMHHIISDGTSMSILVREFTEIYKEEGELTYEAL